MDILDVMVWATIIGFVALIVYWIVDEIAYKEKQNNGNKPLD